MERINNFFIFINMMGNSHYIANFFWHNKGKFLFFELLSDVSSFFPIFNLKFDIFEVWMILLLIFLVP